MARMIPDVTPKDASSGEYFVFNLLKQCAETSGWVVLHSFDLSHHVCQISGEIDIVVMVPDKGVLCLEIKGCKSLRRSDGKWYFSDDPRGDPRGPFKQASSAAHSLRKIASERLPQVRQVPFWSVVVFPFISFPESSAEWHEWQVLDRTKISARSIDRLLLGVFSNIEEHLSNSSTARWFDPEKIFFGVDIVAKLADELRGDFEYFQTAASRAQYMEDELLRYTEEQYSCLDLMSDNKRLLVKGPAGTGKTYLAIESARRYLQQGKTIRTLCFNRLLGGRLQEQLSSFGKSVRTSTLHSMMLEIAGVKPSSFTDKAFWFSQLPLLVVEKLLSMPEDKLKMLSSDALVVDEAQDILAHKPYLDVLDLILSGGISHGEWRFFGDFERQMLYLHEDPTVEIEARCSNYALAQLRINCRNTVPIAQYAISLGGLAHGYEKIRRSGAAAQPTLHLYHNSIEQMGMLSDIFTTYRDAGYSPSDIVVLSPLADDACTAGKLDPGDAIWDLRPIDRKGDAKVPFASVAAFKGMESPVVIITDLDTIIKDSDQMIYYVGCTRALDRLSLLAHTGVGAEIPKILMKRAVS